MKPRASSCRRSEEMMLRARHEDLAHVGIRDQVEIALAVARLHVLQAVPLLRHGKQRLGQELELLRVDAELAGAGAEEIAFHADDVAEIDQLEQRIIALAHRVFLDVDLQPLAVLLQVREARLAHVAQRHHAAGDADADLRRQFLGGLRAVLGQNLGNRVGELESLAIGPVAEGFDLANARQALLEQLIFQRQIDLLAGNKLL